MYILGGRRYCYVTEYRSDQYHALPELRESVLWAFYHLMTHMVTEFLQSAGKPHEHLLILKFRNVLHRDKFRMGLANKACKLIQQTPSFISPCCLLVVLRERLAWRASGKKRDVVPPKIVADLFCCDFRNRLVQEFRIVVMLVRILTPVIKIDAHAHINASLPQSASKPPATAEQIYGVNGISLGLSFPTHDQLPWRQYEFEYSIRIAHASIFAEANRTDLSQIATGSAKTSTRRRISPRAVVDPASPARFCMAILYHIFIPAFRRLGVFLDITICDFQLVRIHPRTIFSPDIRVSKQVSGFATFHAYWAVSP